MERQLISLTDRAGLIIGANMKALLPVAVGLVWSLAISASVNAEDKNGVSLTVSKKTLDRNDTRASSYYSGDRIDRTQGLKATIRNTSIKAQPEGEVKWTIIVRGYSSPDTIQGNTGTEPLKALKASETVEMVLGAAQITGYKGYDMAKDKMEYQIIVSQDGMEKVRFQSTAGFDALAKRARLSKSDSTSEKPDQSTKPTPNPDPVATPKPVAAATPRPATVTPANPFAPTRSTPTPAPKKPTAEEDAPLDGSKLK